MGPHQESWQLLPKSKEDQMQPPSNTPLSSCRGTLTHHAEAGLLWPLTGFLPPPEMSLCLHPLSQQSQWCSLRSIEGVWVWEGWKNPLVLSVQLLSGDGVDSAVARSLLALGPRNRGWGSGHTSGSDGLVSTQHTVGQVWLLKLWL